MEIEDKGDKKFAVKGKTKFNFQFDDDDDDD